MDGSQTLVDWTIALAIATIIMAIATISLAYYSIIESKRNSKAGKFKVYLTVMTMLDATHKEREDINRIIRENPKARFSFDREKNPKNINEKAELIIRDWDKVGLMWEAKAIPNELVYYYSRAIVTSFLYFAEVIKRNRDNKKNSNHRRKFQNLFIFADKYRHINKRYELHDDMHEI